MPESLILVNTQNRQIGTAEKMEVHEKALLHRAFSILIFNDLGELMLQQRDLGKYHSGGKWTNTCCGHPRNHEPLETAIHRRLFEEMGFDTELTEKTRFIYRVALDHELTEHEYLTVFVGKFLADPILNPEEAMDWKWMNVEDLQQDIFQNPECYTSWFQLIVRDHFDEVFLG